MRNPGRFYTMMVAIAVLFTAIVWVFLWGYGTYFQNSNFFGKAIFHDSMVTKMESPHAGPEPVTYSDTLSKLKNIDSDSFPTILQRKLDELETLRMEIRSYLEMHGQPGDSLKPEADTFRVLRLRIDSLDLINKMMEEENRLLRDKVDSLSKNKSGSKNLSPAVSQQKEVSKSGVMLSNVNLFGISDHHTISAASAEIRKLHISFFLRSEKASRGRLHFSLRNPQGKLLIDESRISAVSTSVNQKKNFTGEVSFSSKAQWITFNMPVSGLTKGTYSLRIYYNGTLLAHHRKTFR